MDPSYRKPVILFVSSFTLIIAGMAAKLYHLPFAGIVFGAGMLVQMFSVLWLIFVILKTKK